MNVTVPRMIGRRGVQVVGALNGGLSVAVNHCSCCHTSWNQPAGR